MRRLAVGSLAMWLSAGAAPAGWSSAPAPPRGPSGLLDYPSTTVDTPPPPPNRDKPQPGSTQVTQVEYEGWRQYSVNCARCHGQDVLPNPVAANLLVSLASGGPVDTPEKFTPVVSEGRPHRGMPAFKDILSPGQIQAIYAYVKGRADKRIPPGRPAQPSS